MRLAAAVIVCSLPLGAAAPAEIADQLRKIELDPAACYRVRDLGFTRGDDLRFYLTDGWLMFGKPVLGRRISAMFVADTDTGDAELIVMPPTRGERASLVNFTGSPNLSEHFRGSLFLFTDDTAEALQKLLNFREPAVGSLERGLLFKQDWDPVLANLAASFSVRLVDHLLAEVPAERGFFYAAIQGRKLGNFDVFYDPEATEQIYLGQLRSVENRNYYDTWTSFPARPFRNGARKPPLPGHDLTNYRIEAVLDPGLRLRVATRATLTARRTGQRALGFEISAGMRVTAARINGEEAELFVRESLRANLLRHSESVMFLVLPPQQLDAGRAYEIEFEHEGDVVRPAGQDVYFVSSRGNWYPRAGTLFSTFDLTFTYPAQLQLVFPGDIKEDRTEGETRTTRRLVAAPIRIAGFNLGRYESVKTERGGLSVEVYANRRVENALMPRNRDVIVLPPMPSPWPRTTPRRPEILQLPPAVPNPMSRLDQLAADIASAFEFLAGQLGPPALPQLMVAPIPGAFGQGFPGLVYLSTWTYLNPQERPPAARTKDQRLFFDELLHAHETAHQWWGNVVATSGAQDEWLMEALANYSAILLLERRKGARAAQAVLDQYRESLLEKDEDGRTVDSFGPIRLGQRLVSSQRPEAWHTIVYGKGAWIIHMLRKRLGDEAFFACLRDICREFRHQVVTTDDLRRAAAPRLPKDAPDPELVGFFEHWVEGTGIPEFELSTSVKGRAPKVELTITLRQSGVDEHTSLQVPVEVQIARGRSQVYWLSTGGSEPARLVLPLRAPPLKVTLDPEDAVLRVKR